MQIEDMNEVPPPVSKMPSSVGDEKSDEVDFGKILPKETKSFNKLAFLYPLRFILAFGIILWHCPFGVADNYDAHPILFSIRAITIYGGNQAFLLIAGMMFYLSYYSKLVTEKMKVGEFLKKRAIRIYPMVIVTVLVSYILSLITHFTYNAQENINLMDLIKDMFFFGSRLFGGDYGIYNGPIWFLAPLFVSYLISALIIAVTKKKRSIYWFLIPLSITFFTGLGSNFIVPAFNFFTIANECFNFFLGIFFMVFLQNFDKWSNKIKIPLRIICLAVAIVFLYAFYASRANSPLGNGEMIGSLFCWIPLMTCLFGLKPNILFDNFVFKTLGAVSFHMYVWHGVVNKAWNVFFALRQKPVYFGTPQALFIFLSLVMLISVISYAICEIIRKYKVADKIKTKLCGTKPSV